MGFELPDTLKNISSLTLVFTYQDFNLFTLPLLNSFYDKYRFNLKEKNALLQSGNIFNCGKERDLLLSEIDDTDFYSFLNEFQVFLKKIVKNIGQET